MAKGYWRHREGFRILIGENTSFKDHDVVEWFFDEHIEWVIFFEDVLKRDIDPKIKKYLANMLDALKARMENTFDQFSIRQDMKSALLISYIYKNIVKPMLLQLTLLDVPDQYIKVRRSGLRSLRVLSEKDRRRLPQHVLDVFFSKKRV